jgi:hypothetical protein
MSAPLPYSAAKAKYLALVGPNGKFLGSQLVKELFEEEANNGISYYNLGKDTYPLAPLSEEEIARIIYFVRNNAKLMQRADPYTAENFLKHESIIVKYAAIAKAIFGKNQPINYPATPGSIGIAPIIPQVLQSTLNSGGVGWATDGTWDINLTAGTAPNYLLGTTNFFTTSGTPNQQLLCLVLQDGVVEVGSTPAIDQLYLISVAKSQYTPWAVQPLVSESAMLGKSIYVYNTLGFFDLTSTLGVRFAARAKYNRSPANIRLIGVAYYEYAFWATGGASPSPFI